MHEEQNNLSLIDDKKYWLILENYGLLGGKYHEYAAAGKEIYWIATNGFNIPEDILPPIEHWYCMLGSAGIIDTLVDNEINNPQDLRTSSLVVAELFEYISLEQGCEQLEKFENLFNAVKRLSIGEQSLLFECGIPLFKYYFSKYPDLLKETYYIFGSRLNLPHSVKAEDIATFRSTEAVALTNFFTLTISNPTSEKDIENIRKFTHYLYELIAWGNTLDSYLDFNEDLKDTYLIMRDYSITKQKQVQRQLFRLLISNVPSLVVNPGTLKTIQAITGSRAKHMLRYATTGKNKY